MKNKNFRLLKSILLNKNKKYICINNIVVIDNNNNNDYNVKILNILCYPLNLNKSLVKID